MKTSPRDIQILSIMFYRCRVGVEVDPARGRMKTHISQELAQPAVCWETTRAVYKAMYVRRVLSSCTKDLICWLLSQPQRSPDESPCQSIVLSQRDEPGRRHTKLEYLSRYAPSFHPGSPEKKINYHPTMSYIRFVGSDYTIWDLNTAAKVLGGF